MMPAPEPAQVCNCILFDLDGTLYSSREYNSRFDLEAAATVSELLSVTPEEAGVLLKDGRSRFGTLTRTLQNLKIDRELFFQEIAKRIDTAKYLSPDPSLNDLLSRLRAYGLKIGLVSNSARPIVKKTLSAIGLALEQFDVVVTSSDAEPKPSPEPFLIALQRIGSNVNHSVYVGDRDSQELRPAKELGMKTILIDRDGSSTSKWADYVVRNLSELQGVLNAFRWVG